MAFVKDPLNATNPREIIEYSQDLEDRVELGFDDVDDITTSLSGDVNALNGQVISSTTTEIDTPTNVLSGFDLSSLRVTKRNNVVIIFGRIQGNITPTFQNFCKIGTGFRPPTQVFAVGWASFANSNLSQVQISTNGDMYIRSQLNGTSVDINISYTVN